MRSGASASSARVPGFSPSTTSRWVGAPRRLLGLRGLGPCGRRGRAVARRLGDPRAEHVGADHRDRGQHEDPEDGQVRHADEEEGQLRHSSPRPPRVRRRCGPSSRCGRCLIVDPSRRRGASHLRCRRRASRWSSRGRTSTRRRSMPLTSSSRWRRLTPGSLIRRSASVPRPTTRPGGRSGWRVPLTSRVARARRACGVRWSLSVTLACAWLRIRKRPVVRSSADSKAMLTGPGKT